MDHTPARPTAATTAAITGWQPGAAARDTTVLARVLERIDASIPGNTRRAYAGDWSRFAAWCDREGRQAPPATPETLAEYASHLADQSRSPATITRALSSVRVIHQLGGHEPPELRPARAVVTAYRGERADAGLPNARPAVALSAGHLRKASAALDPNDVRQLRDRAVLVLGWAMTGRRHVLAGLDIGDVASVEQGLDVTVRRDKTDQDAQGRTVAVPYGTDPLTCPVRVTLAWITLLADRGITAGPLFRYVDRHGHIAGQPGVTLAGSPPAAGNRLTGHAINLITRRAGRKAGLPDDVLAGLSAHSLRAGGATGAYLGGAGMLAIARHGGWTDGSQALYRYIRNVDRWLMNPMYKAGL